MQEPKSIQQIIIQKPYLCWYISDKENISDELAFESILNYGNWEDVQNALKIMTNSKAKKIFEELANKPRTNLRPKTINYFKHYFNAHAS